MNIDQYIYALLLLGTLLIPLIRSFENRVHYYRKFRYLIPAIILPAIVFIVWDVIFTAGGIWEFNHEYITGFHIVNLPVEEWLFFIIIPYACVFVYEVINYFFPKINLPKLSLYLLLVLLALSVYLIIAFHDRLYTVTVSSFLAGMLIIQFLTKSYKTYLTRAFVSYFINVLPFVLVNGILTSMPIVIYNNSENMAHRLYTIPWEDFLYFLVLYLMNINLFEFLRNKYPLNPKRKSEVLNSQPGKI